jgi:hypothetical protein
MSSVLESVDLRAFPTYTYRPGAILWRIHWRGDGCWYFSGDGSGRFDPSSSPGYGACYFGEHPLCAWIETMRTRMALDQDEMDSRWLTEARLPRAITVLDLANRKALSPGFTVAELSAKEYSYTNAVAAEVVALGLEGIRWRARHDLGGQLMAVALFGPRGSPDDAQLAALPRTVSRPIPAALIADARRQFGYRILPSP